MKFKLLAGVAAAAVCAASGASAQDAGWYGAVDLGYHWPEGIDASSSNNSAAGAPYNWDVNQEEDWAGFARLGYQLNANWRVELEGGYRPGDIESIRGGSTNAIIGLCAPGVVRSTAAPTCSSPSGDHSGWQIDSFEPPATRRGMPSEPSAATSASHSSVPSHGMRGRSQHSQARWFPSGEMRGAA